MIPAQLISALSKPSDVILDPFCGCGTSILEAAKLGRTSIGSDVNPYAIFITKTKLELLTGKQLFVPRLKQIAENLIPDNSDLFATADGSLNQYGNLNHPNQDELALWFEEKTLNELVALYHLIEDQSGLTRNLLRMILMGVLFNSTGHRSKISYTYFADNVKPKSDLLRKNILELFGKKLQTFIGEYESKQSENKSAFDIRLEDARSLNLDRNSIDLIVTSPPYLGVTDYINGFRLTQICFPDLFKDITTAKSLEIAPRRHRHSKKLRENYLVDMTNVFKNMYELTKPDGKLAMVIGEPKKYEFTIIEQLTEDIEPYFTIEESHSRDVTKKFFKHPFGGVASESILIFSRTNHE